MLVIGGFMWLIVAIRIRDWPLIVTNLVMSTVGLAAILYTLNADERAFEAMGEAQEQRELLRQENPH